MTPAQPHPLRHASFAATAGPLEGALVRLQQLHFPFGQQAHRCVSLRKSAAAKGAKLSQRRHDSQSTGRARLVELDQAVELPLVRIILRPRSTLRLAAQHPSVSAESKRFATPK